MKSNWFKGNGFLSEEGQSAFLEIRTQLENLLDSDEVRDMSVQELHILGSCLAKLTGDAISSKIVRRQKISQDFDKMTDKEFYAHLTDKYGEEVWQFSVLSPEELARCPAPSLEDFEKLMKD